MEADPSAQGRKNASEARLTSASSATTYSTMAVRQSRVLSNVGCISGLLAIA
jgi:hypothetical protein